MSNANSNSNTIDNIGNDNFASNIGIFGILTSYLLEKSTMLELDVSDIKKLVLRRLEFESKMDGNKNNRVDSNSIIICPSAVTSQKLVDIIDSFDFSKFASKSLSKRKSIGEMIEAVSWKGELFCYASYEIMFECGFTTNLHNQTRGKRDVTVAKRIIGHALNRR